MFEAGDVFEGKYRVDSVAGEGGFGIVVRATTLSSGRVVAIKLLKTQKGGYETSREQRFLREMRAIANLQCPYTLTLYDFGRTADGLLYMVCEFVEGDDLLNVLVRRERLPEGEVIRILHQVLESLAEAHDHGILHRDIKPANIRVYWDDAERVNVKVLDFGLAKSLDPGEARLTGTGKVIGTPRYMAPEQLIGVELTPACDIYSLGVVAVEMLAGRQRTAGVGPARKLALTEADDVSPALRALIAKMVEADPDRRWQSAAELLGALRDLRRRGKPATVDREPPTVVARPTSDVSAAPKPATVEPTRKLNLALVAGVAALVLVLALVLASRRTEPPDEPTQERTPRPPPEPLLGQAVANPEPVPEAKPQPPSSCGMPQPPGLMWLWSGADISWAVHVPAGYDRARRLPVFLFIPDEFSANADRLRTTGLAALADQESFVAVIPVMDTDQHFVWREQHANLTRSMLDDLAQSVCIDRQRVYAFGDGQGGGRLAHLSCRAWVTAIASHDFRPKPLGCVRRRPHLHSVATDGKVIPFEGGGSCVGLGASAPSDDRMRERWLAHHGCSNERSEQFDHPGGECWSYADCDAPFVMCHTVGGAGWPGEPGAPTRSICRAEPLPSDFPELEVAWRFFEPFELSGPDCGEAAKRTGRREIREREARGLLVVPKGYTGEAPLPVVVAFHDEEQTATTLLDGSQLEKLAAKHQVAVLVPAGEQKLTWRGDYPGHGVRDLLDRAAEETCLDLERVALIGDGKAGAHAVERLSCDPWIAAVAVDEPELLACKVVTVPDHEAAFAWVAQRRP